MSADFAHFVRTHEKALANALQSRQRISKTGQDGLQAIEASSHPLVAQQTNTTTSSVSSALVAALTLGTLNLTSRNVKSAKLTLSSHHLFYLLSRFEDMGVPVGPMNVRTENLHAETSPANYVSFLSQSQRSHGRSDRDSIHSVSSVRSVMSGVSALWSGFSASNNASKTERAEAQLMLDLKYLYSAFTKIPCLRLSPDQSVRLIRNHEEFPFDTAVPLLVFKNLTALEICDVDFRHFFGWDKLAEQLRSVTLKRANIDDPADLITSIVLDDMEKRRRRSSKTRSSPVLAWPLTPPSPPVRLVEAARAPSASDSEGLSQSKPGIGDNPPAVTHSSRSPNRPTNSWQNSSYRHARNGNKKFKRSGSGSSDSSVLSNPPPEGVRKTGSSANLLLAGQLQPSKWRFLRHLSLADNALTTIPANSFEPLANSLHSLDLSSNLFTEIPDGLANLSVLRALNLSNCMIGSLQSLLRNPITAITVLNLRANRLGSIVGVEKLLSLDRLDLRENRLGDPTELARLTGLPDFREVWVAQNPFTRSHGDYRRIIFNLFRRTPGNIDDICIDTSGPTHHERKHLVDRIAEVEPVSVIRTRHPETDFQAATVDNSNTETSKPSLTDTGIEIRDKPFSSVDSGGQQVETEIAQKLHAAAKSRRTTKSTRRQRVVDLAAEKDLVPNTSSTLLQADYSIQGGERPSADLADMVAAHSLSEAPAASSMRSYSQPSVPNRAPAESKDGTAHGRTLSSMSFSADQSLLGNDTQTAKLEAQAYRQKIEALKHEVGGNWLTALNEERLSKNEQSSANQADMSTMNGAVRPGLSLIRAPSQGVT
ncbi:MAG: hypothetical protein LQ349_001626 [Xanthoria aureola]|nr:MAG: hypothetical protein LQ349_001626 [Xanthoria aureola]